MEYYIEKEIKGYKKNYSTKKGAKETNPSLSIYLGAKTEFKPNETVIISNKEYFNTLLNNSNPSKENKEEVIRLTEELEEVKGNFLEQSRINDELNLELSRIKKELNNTENDLNNTKNDLNDKDKELSEVNETLREKSDKIESLYGAILYYKEVINKYKQLNLIKRIFKYDVEKNLKKSEIEIETNKK